MGTNFYTSKDDNSQHIGKRSATGFYCWDCKETLCKNGIEGIHLNKSKWYKRCPKCGQNKTKENLQNNSVGRELGFNKNNPKKKTGVKSCSSFTWTIDPSDFALKAKSKEIVAIDEYGKEYTKEEFSEMLKECPILYFDMINQEFT